jgi:chromate transporter
MNAIALQPLDWLNLFLYYISLSLLAVGGAIAAAPDMHRFLVERQGWLTDVQFNASIAIAQAAPGPNVLFIALLGWNVGLNAGGAGAIGWASGALGVLLCMVGVMLPSTTLTWLATRWGHRNRDRRGVRAFKQGTATRPPTGRCGCSPRPPWCWCGARACTCCGCWAPGRCWAR